MPETTVCFLGVHGGSGASTVAQLGHQRGLSTYTARQWPQPPHGRASVVLVARTHAHGLARACAAATEWAAEDVPWINLLGLVLVADGPKPHPDLRRAIAATTALVPITWTIGWHENWRALEARQSHPIDTRTKYTLGRIRRLLTKSQRAAAAELDQSTSAHIEGESA